jgi:hypothetical protein
MSSIRRASAYTAESASRLYAGSSLIPYEKLAAWVFVMAAHTSYASCTWVGPGNGRAPVIAARPRTSTTSACRAVRTFDAVGVATSGSAPGPGQRVGRRQPAGDVAGHRDPRPAAQRADDREPATSSARARAVSNASSRPTAGEDAGAARSASVTPNRSRSSAGR